MQFLFAQVVLSYLSNRRHLIYVIFLLENFKHSRVFVFRRTVSLELFSNYKLTSIYLIFIYFHFSF